MSEWMKCTGCGTTDSTASQAVSAREAVVAWGFLSRCRRPYTYPSLKPYNFRQDSVTNPEPQASSPSEGYFLIPKKELKLKLARG